MCSTQFVKGNESEIQQQTNCLYCSYGACNIMKYPNKQVYELQPSV